MRKLSLVSFEEPVWSTVQGEGVLVGTPSVFVRMQGCTVGCSWCDTKTSWAPGEGRESSLGDVLKTARRFRLKHAVITGGEPLEQLDEALDIAVGLNEPWYDHEAVEAHRYRSGMHITLETSVPFYDEGVSRHVQLLSMSPKLGSWRQDVVDEYVKDLAVFPSREAQVKVVCQDRADTLAALEHFDRLWGLLGDIAGSQFVRSSLHFVLQPEWSTGKIGLKLVWGAVQEWLLRYPAGVVPPTIRVIPQTHKAFGFK